MTASSLLRSFALLVALAGATGAMASPGIEPVFGGERIEADGFGDEIFATEGEPQLFAQADCSAAASQAAAQTGGQVLSVQATNQGGQTVCVVTVLIPGQGGERPRRTTITLPG